MQISTQVTNSHIVVGFRTLENVVVRISTNSKSIKAEPLVSGKLSELIYLEALSVEYDGYDGQEGRRLSTH